MRQCFSQPSQAILDASSCRSISGEWQRDVLYQCLFSPALWETSSFCSSSQLSTWFMEKWAISRLAPQSSPDELVPSAHVTTVCFLHSPIFIYKLSLPCFWGSYFFHLVPYMACFTITGDMTQGMNCTEQFGTCLFFPPPSLWYE